MDLLLKDVPINILINFGNKENQQAGVVGTRSGKYWFIKIILFVLLILLELTGVMKVNLLRI